MTNPYNPPRRMRVPALLPTFLVLWGTGGGPTACVPRANPAQALAKHAIATAMDRYLAAYHRNDPASMSELYAPDGVLLPPGRRMIRGRDAIREFWEQGMETGIQMETLDIAAGSGTGYVVGRYYVPADADAGAEWGKYIITFQRQSDGVWRVAADIWNEDGDGSDEESPDSTARVAAIGGS